MTYVFLILNHMSYSQSNHKLINFQSEDGVEISADLYMIHPETAPFIVLFHQANWSRGEYNEIAPKLNAMGYNCLAVDLRSGGMINNVTNITKLNATKAMKSTQYVDALADMSSAVNYARENFATDKLIIWGSSYSSSLSLVLAAEMEEQIDAVLAFSPGEYFSSQGKPRNYVTTTAGEISQPVFIASARSEKGSWWGIYISMVSEKKIYYLPNSVGNHGSKALWEQYPDSNGYWEAVTDFLKSI
jgi:dienelactone hydrolase